MGLDRVLLALEGEGRPVPSARAPTCFVVALGGEARDAGTRLVDALRTEGIAAAHAFEERPLKAQLKMADRAGAAFAAIVGERELAGGTITLRRLVDGVQKSVPLDDVAEWLTARGSGGGAGIRAFRTTMRCTPAASCGRPGWRGWTPAGGWGTGATTAA
jgi:histidyl-tRNA synthetase